jgi:type II restriction enzyme
VVSIQDAKMRLDSIIAKARIDLYKPIQIAEVLRKSRSEKNIKILDLKTYQNQSIRWRDEVILNPV